VIEMKSNEIANKISEQLRSRGINKKKGIEWHLQPKLEMAIEHAVAWVVQQDVHHQTVCIKLVVVAISWRVNVYREHDKNFYKEKSSLDISQDEIDSLKAIVKKGLIEFDELWGELEEIGVPECMLSGLSRIISSDLVWGERA